MKTINKNIFLLLTFVFINSGILGKSKIDIEIKDAWIRPAAKDANSALYFTIINMGNKPDTLIGAESKIAEIVEVHETYKMKDGRVGMRQVKSIVIPPNSQIEFKPGNYHVMILGVYKDYKIGNEFIAVLVFKLAGKIKIKAVVKDMQ